MATPPVTTELIGRDVSFSSALRSARAEVARTTQEVQRQRPALQQYARDLAGIATAYLSIRSIANQVRGVLDVGREVEQLRTQLTGLFGTAVQGRAAFDWIAEYQGRLPGFTEAFVLLKGAGVDPTLGSLAALNDAAALLGGTKDKLVGITLQLTQALQKEKLQQADIKPIIERGIPVWSLLAEATGRSTAELQKMSEKGRLGRDSILQLIDAIGRFAQGAAARGLGTVTGLIGQLSQEARGFLTAIGDAGALAFFRTQLQRLLSTIVELRQSGKLDEYAQQISRAIVTVGEGIARLSETLFDGLRRALDSGALQVAAEGISGLLTVVSSAIKTAIDVVDDFGIAALKLIGIFEALALAVKSIAIIGFLVALVRFRALIALAATGAATLVVNLVKWSATLIGISRGLAGLALTKFVTDVLELTGAARGLTGILQVLGLRLAFLGALAVGVTAAMLALAGAWYYGYRQIQQLRQEQERLAQSTAFIRSYNEAWQEINERGLGEEHLKILQQIRQQWADGLISDKEARTQLDDYAASVLNTYDKLEAARNRLSQIIRQRDQAEFDAAKTAADQVYEAWKTSLENRVSVTQSALSAARSAEQQYANDITRINQTITDTIRQTEFELADLRRESSSGSERSKRFDAYLEELNLAREVQGKLADLEKARTATQKQEAALRQQIQDTDDADQRAKLQAELQALQAQNQARQQALQAEINTINQRRQALISEQTDATTQVARIKQLGADRVAALEQEKLAAADAREAEAKQVDTLVTKLKALKDQVQEAQTLLTAINKEITTDYTFEAEQAKKEIAEIQRQLDELPRTIKVDLDQSEIRLKARAELDDIQARRDVSAWEKLLNRIPKEVKTTLVIEEQRRSAGGPISPVPGFASGGKLPGYGGGDRIRALLEAGEFVIRKEVVRALGGDFFKALNAGRIGSALTKLGPITPPALGLTNNLLRAPHRFATGGPVLADSGGGELTLTFRAPNGQTARTRTTRQDAAMIVSLFSGFADVSGAGA